MKSLLLMLAMTLPGLAFADLTINLNGSAVSTAPLGCRGTLSTTPTYALNAASPTVASVAIDLGANPDVFVSVTGAANIPGGPVVAALFAPTSTGTFQVGYKLVGAGNACVPRLNRYLKLVNMSQMSSATYSAKALTVTASYMLATAADTVAVTGMGSLSTSAATSAGFLTGAAATSANQALIYGAVSKAAAVSYNAVSSVAYAITNNVVTAIPLTVAAGVASGVISCYFSSNGNIRWAIAASAPAHLTGTAGHYQAGSTTPIPMIDYDASTNPNLYVVGAAQNCDLWLSVLKKQ